MSEPAYHHTTELEHVRYGLIWPHRVLDALPAPAHGEDCDWSDHWHTLAAFEAAYSRLEQAVGFRSLWLAVARGERGIRATGYASQFLPPSQKQRWIGEPPRDSVCFSFEAPPPGCVHLLSEAWNLVISDALNSPDSCRPVAPEMSSEFRDWLLDPGRTPASWRRRAESRSHDVEALVPWLDLRAAARISARSQRSRAALVRLGFAPEKVELLRLKPHY